MARERVTSQQVARRAGVSQSAVSRVFSGSSASPATIEKVRRAAAELGYRPNVLARSLITGKSRIVGVVVAYLDNQFYPDALERLSNALQAEGYHILIFTAAGHGEGAEQVFDELIDYQVDGIVAASVGISDKLAARCEAAGIPVVLFNRGQDDPRLAEVTSDNRAAAAQVAEFLVAGGHRRIAQVRGWQGSTTGRDRAVGFREALEKAGHGPVQEVDGLYRRDTAAEATRRLMDRSDPPDAIFAANDHMAFAVLDVLRHELRMRIPEEVSVVGFDDVPMAAWGGYRLTTYRQPLGEMVRRSVAALLGRIEDRERPVEKLRVQGSLIVRDSAKVPEGWA